MLGSGLLMSSSTNEAYDLLDHCQTTYSQSGEEGIIAKIFEVNNITQGFFVEFGAWDGEYLSNTRSLCDQGWKGLFIEGDAAKYKDLEVKFAGHPQVMTEHALIDCSGPSSLDNILKKRDVPQDFEVLSIDVDGDDYHLWQACQEYRPKVVIIEYNYTFPYNVDFVPKRGCYIGSSALAQYRLAHSKGYKHVCSTFTNNIFVRDDLAPQLNLKNSSFAYLFNMGRYEEQYERRYAGFFASDYRGHWSYLYSNPAGWGVNKIADTNKALLKETQHLNVVSDRQELAKLFANQW